MELNKEFLTGLSISELIILKEWAVDRADVLKQCGRPSKEYFPYDSLESVIDQRINELVFIK